MGIRTVLLIEGLANLAVVTAKLAVGAATGSAAILGDALHSLTDFANNIVAFVVAGVSDAPPDREHPYGHRKFESLAVFALATLLTVAAIELGLRAFTRRETPVETSDWGMAVMIGVLVANVMMASWESYWARRLDSDLLRADSRHTLADILTTVAVIGGWQLAAHGYAWVDPVFALLIAGLVFYLAAVLFRHAVPGLVDRAGVDPAALTETVGAIAGVREVRRVRTRMIGRRIFADIVVTVDGALSTSASHEVADRVERALADTWGIEDVSVHVEPRARA